MGEDVSAALEREFLHSRLEQRDGEIRILLRMMKQERKRADRAESALNAAGMGVRAVSPASPDRLSPLRLARTMGVARTVGVPTAATPTVQGSIKGSLLSSSAAEHSNSSSRMMTMMQGSEFGSELRESADEAAARGVAKHSGDREEGNSENWKTALKEGTYACMYDGTCFMVREG